MTTHDDLDPESSGVMVGHTDGSCYPPTDGDGGWAIHLAFGGFSEVRFGYSDKATNNTMELTAMLRLLQFTPINPPAPLIIFTDSQYVLRSIEDWIHGWKENGWVTTTGKPVANRELLEQISALLELHRKHRVVSIRWVRGHAGHPENELVDHHASTARKRKVTRWNDSTDIRTTVI